MFSATEFKEQGNHLASEGKFEEAIKKYDAAIQADPKLASAWLNKGLMHRHLKQFENATAAFKQAITLDSNYTKAKINLGDVLYLQKKYKEAWGQYYSVLQKEPQQLDATIGRFNCEQHIGARLVFANVDLKLTKEGKVKVLEFGRGMQSGFVGLYVATGIDVNKFLMQKTEQLGLPPLILNSAPGIEISDSKILDKVLAQLSIPTEAFLPEQIKSYRAIYGGTNVKSNDERILILDDSAVDFVFGDKLLTHKIFAENNQLDERPKTLMFERKYYAELAKQIRQGLPGVKQFVLKVPDKEGGKGVIIVKDEDLEVTLKFLLTQEGEKKIIQASKEYTQHFMQQYLSKDAVQAKVTKDMDDFEIWNRSDSHQFMVEEYIANKPVTFNGKAYDATMRVAFLWIRDQEKISCEPFACYWKLPPKPSDDEGLIRERTVSSFSETRHDAIVVNKDDQQLVYQQLQAILPNILQSMTQMDVPTYIESLKQVSDKQINYKAYLWMHFGNSLAHQGQFILAENYINKAKKLIPDDFKIDHELGILYHFREDYETAKKFYDAALKKHPKNAATYYRRGLTLLELNKPTDAEKDFQVASQLSPVYATKILKFKEIKEKQFQVVSTNVKQLKL